MAPDPRSRLCASPGAEMPGLQITCFISHRPAAALGEAVAYWSFSFPTHNMLLAWWGCRETEEIGRKLKDLQVLCKFGGRGGRSIKGNISVA